MEKELTFENQKFEKAVRESIRIEDNPITTTLVKNVDFLCLLDCELSDSDFDTLYQFKNLEGLIIGETSGTFDLCRLTSFKKLEYLSIHGGEYSVMDILNVSALQELRLLKKLEFVGFRNVDLNGIEKLQQLEALEILWGITLENADLIGTLKNLNNLFLCDIQVSSLDFITHLNKDAEICLGDVIVDQPFDMKKLDSFTNFECDCCQINGGLLSKLQNN